MIPSYSVVPEISLPAGTDCGYPTRDEISEEGFGYFRGTWWLGHVPLSNARQTVEFERDLVAALDTLADDEQEFEDLAAAVEHIEPDDGEVPLLLRDTPVEGLIRPFIDDDSLLGGLEIGVAGLTYALSTVGFRTAASCRAHPATSWTDYPVVLFGAHKWRAVLVAELAAEAGCGIGQDRDMLTIYAPSIKNLMSLAEAVLVKRATFRAKPGTHARRKRRTGEAPNQTTLGI